MTVGILLHLSMTLTFCTFIGLSMSHLFISSIISWGLLFIIEPAFDTNVYASRLLRALLFSLAQIKSIITSSLSLCFKLVTRQYHNFSPSLISIDIKDYSPTEIMIASYAINLSPGSAVVCVDTTKKMLHIHLLEVHTPDTSASDIISTIFTPITRFTRP